MLKVTKETFERVRAAVDLIFQSLDTNNGAVNLVVRGGGGGRTGGVSVARGESSVCVVCVCVCVQEMALHVP